MPSPYGDKRNAAQYYQYAAEPRHYAYAWKGLPAGAARRSAGQAELSGDGPEYVSAAAEIAAYEAVGAAGDDYIDVVAQAHLHKSLGDEGDVDADAMARHYSMDGYDAEEDARMAKLARDYATADAGKYPTWPVAMTMETARRSVRHSGPEQTQLYDGRPSLGFFGAMSDNEKRALMLVAVAGAGYLFWKQAQKKARRANPRIRNRRRRRR